MPLHLLIYLFIYLFIYLLLSIGINHGFEWINIGRISRKVFEHEAAGRVQTLSEGPGEC